MSEEIEKREAELLVKNLANQCWIAYTKLEKERFYARIVGGEKAEKLDKTVKKACGEIEELRWVFSRIEDEK